MSPDEKKEENSSEKAVNQTVASSTAKQASSLAERLDLLEVRLRMPPAPPSGGGGGGGGGQSFQCNNSNAMPLDDMSHLTFLGSPQISQHSFQFDGLSRSSAATDHHSSFHQMLLQSPPTSRPHPPSASLEALSRAAEEHLRKIAALQEEEHSRSDDGSFQTVHHTNAAAAITTAGLAEQQDQVVQESPPIFKGIHTATSTAPVAPKLNSPRALNMTQQPRMKTQSFAVETFAKENNASISTTTTTTTNNNNINAGSGKENNTQKKRKSTPTKLEINSTANKARKHANAAAATEGVPKRSRLQIHKDGSIPQHKQPAKDGAVNNSSTYSKSGNTPTKANIHTIIDPTKITHTNTTTSTNNSITGATKQHKAPKNNRLIRDFFTAKYAKDSVNNKFPAEPPQTPPPVLATNSPHDATPSPLQQVSTLQQKLRQMEQLLSEKDAQLKAVSNNRTILQTAVQSALKQRETELKQVTLKFDAYKGQVSTVIETLMRQQAFQQVAARRERLAADATRLGRIVYARAGMRSVESWEEGTESRRLDERRDQLLAQKAELEQRQAKTTEQEAVENQGHPSTPIDALEAKESVRYHLETVQRKLRELETEAKRLKQEKIEHLQAWKRQASEDASRFRDRPKVRLVARGGVLVIISR
jgi:hypothetical protein